MSENIETVLRFEFVKDVCCEQTKEPSENQIHSGKAFHPIGNLEVLYKKGVSISTSKRFECVSTGCQ